jgi:hypothetical protein
LRCSTGHREATAFYGQTFGWKFKKIKAPIGYRRIRMGDEREPGLLEPEPSEEKGLMGNKKTRVPAWHRKRLWCQLIFRHCPKRSIIPYTCQTYSVWPTYLIYVIIILGVKACQAMAYSEVM